MLIPHDANAALLTDECRSYGITEISPIVFG